MTFDELHLACAITKARCRFGSGDVFTDARKLELAKAVFEEWVILYGDTYFPFDKDQVASIYMGQRKKGKDATTAADIALAHKQFQCFWTGRGKGPCSAEVDAGHIIPASSGAPLTVANGVIECSYHNRSRGTMSIEQYLALADEGVPQ